MGNPVMANIKSIKPAESCFNDKLARRNRLYAPTPVLTAFISIKMIYGRVTETNLEAARGKPQKEYWSKVCSLVKGD